MYIPKKNRFEMFLKRKSSTSSHKSNTITNNWSEACTEFIKDFVLLRRRLSLSNSSKGRIAYRSSNDDILNDPNLCLDQLSEFQKSYVTFPEYSDASTISNDSEVTSASGVQSVGGHYWIISSSCSTTISNL